MELMIQDFRHAARSLSRSRGFVLVTVLSLALGIGANATVFTLGNGLLFKPVTAPHPERLIRAHYGDHSPFSYADFADVRDQSASVVTLAGTQPARVAIGRAESGRLTNIEVVTGNYFSMLGLPATAGRYFTADEGAPTSSALVVVVGERLASRDFPSVASAIGQALVVNGTTYTIIGVVPESFRGIHFGLGAEAWIPISAGPRLLGMNLARRQVGGGLYTFGRLAPGVTSAQASAALNLAANRLSAAFPEIHRSFTISVAPARGVPEEMWQALAVIVSGALVMSVFVLLIACSNVINVSLARAAARRREVAVRAALGASRWRLVRQLASESAILAVVAALAGFAAASWASIAAVSVIPSESPLALVDLSPDFAVYALTALATAVVVFACGVLPALRSSKFAVADSIRVGASTADPRGAKLRVALVGVQVALCTVLLVGSGLFLRSLASAGSIRPGFEPNRVLNIRLDARLMSLDSVRGREFYRNAVERLAALPGVEGATLANLVPLSFDNNGMSFTIEGRTAPPDAERPEARFNITAPGYLSTLGIPLLRGRDFAATDDDHAPFVAVINETMAARYWPGEDAIGKQFGRDVWGNPATVIGIAKDSKYTTLGESPTAFMYLPFAQHYSTAMVAQLRTAGDPASLAPAVRAELRALAPNLPLTSVRPLADEIQVALLPARIGAAVLGAFGILALLLALGGVYGVAAYNVAQRRREIGIRAALGGSTRRIVAFVLRGSLWPVAVGVLVGVLLALGAGQGMASFLYGVSATDLMTFALVPSLLAGAAALACLVPARRAARVEPIVALRTD